MRHLVRPSLLALIAVLHAAAPIGAAVRLVVTVPKETAPDAKLYLAGSFAEVGAWRADGRQLVRQPDGTYTADLPIEPGQTLEYKINQGSWETVEKDAEGGEIANRTLRVEADMPPQRIEVRRWSTGKPEPVRSTVVGELRRESVPTEPRGWDRTLYVWLPPGFDARRRYPVLYMLDGQNCFDRATSAFGNEWEIDETLTRLIADKVIPPIIAVGIEHGGATRINEYTPSRDASGRGGEGNRHADFIAEAVKPYIDRRYPTRSEREHTFIGGSSLGGLLSLYVAHRYPQTFGGAIAMSPSLWWADQSLTRMYARGVTPLAKTRLWIDMGAREDADPNDSAKYVEHVREMDEILTEGHVEHRLLIDPEGQHNEQAWARRFPDAITYLLRPSPTTKAN